MKGFLFIVLILGCSIFAVANYLGYQKTGILPVKEWILHAKNSLLPSLKDSVAQITGKEASPKNTVKISKWTDANGVVHYENRAVNGANTIEVNPNDNVLTMEPLAEASTGENAKPKAKTMEEEVRELQEAKQAQMDAVIYR